MGSIGALLKHPEDVPALVRMKIAQTHVLKQIPSEPDLAFCFTMLQRVSRSFAFVIQQLGPDLRNDVECRLASESSSKGTQTKRKFHCENPDNQVLGKIPNAEEGFANSKEKFIPSTSNIESTGKEIQSDMSMAIHSTIIHMNGNSIGTFDPSGLIF